MRGLLKQNAEAQVREIFEALNAGSPSFRPSVGRLTGYAGDLFDEHREKVIHVGVSDGIQEVSPDCELSLWLRHPLNMPVELTLSPSLAQKRDTISNQVIKSISKRTGDRVQDSRRRQVEEYLKNLKETYGALSKDWVAGESTVGDILAALSETLRKADNDAVRIFRTETTNYFNESRHSYFSDNTDVDYMELFAVTDGRISIICADRHGAVVTIAEAGLRIYLPAFHPHCRTIQRPLISFLTRDKSDIEKGLAYRARTESSWTPIVF
ncbi:MAG: minor capsid protein [Candidatus Pacebacteria bacterium]|nr:minor capsid protein [Candidatus Paceibacterota bacterium]